MPDSFLEIPVSSPIVNDALISAALLANGLSDAAIANLINLRNGSKTGAANDNATAALINLLNGSKTGQAFNNNTFSVFTPQMFGAVGDGVANDTVAVQAAITAALTSTNPANGERPPYVGTNGTVFFPLGTYLVDELSVPGTISMLGAGGGTYASSTLFQRTAGQAILRLKADTDGQSNSTKIENLMFKSGSGTSALVAQIVTDVGIQSNSIYIRNCWFKSPERYAIWMTQGGDTQISGCTFDISAFHSIRLGSGANYTAGDTTIINCTFSGVALNCIELDNAIRISIIGNRASYPNTSTGVFISYPSTGQNKCEEITVIGNVIDGYFAIAQFTTVAFNVVFNGNPSRHISGVLLEIYGGGVMYGLNWRNNFCSAETTFSQGAAFYAHASGLQYSRIDADVFSTASTALVYNMSDGRVTNNKLAGGLFLGFTAEQNLAAPASNGY